MGVNMFKEKTGGVSFYVENNIGYIKLTNPIANKMNDEFFLELSEIVEMLDKSENVDKLYGIIVSGEGKHFSAGAEVERLQEMMVEVKSSNKEIFSLLPEGHIRDKRTFMKLGKLPVPVVAVIRGFCIGSGMELALACNVRIAEKKAKVGFPESTFGFFPALAGNVRTFEISGLQNAINMVFSGDIYKAYQLEDTGLFDYLVGKNEGMDLAVKLIKNGDV